MRNSGYFYCSLLLAGFLTACTTSGNETVFSKKAVQPPFRQVNIEPLTLELNASEGKTFALPNGSVISVPPKCFRDAEGNEIKGNVQLSYREFHDAADIILSGIPMTYDSAGISGNFQTAGMFDIRGYQKNKAIYVAEGKSIEVKMVSYTLEHDYNFYVLDEESGNWSYQGQGKNEVNEEKMKKLASLAPGPEIPIELKEASEDQFVFDLDLDVDAYPELKEFKGLMWQYAGNSEAADPEKNQWIFSRKWTDVELTDADRSNSSFRLLLKNGSQSFETLITPVLKGRELEKAKKQFEKGMVKYREALAFREKQAERMKMEADLYRTFAVSDFGIYNYDRFYKMPEALHVAADFDYEGKEGDKSGIQVYLITGDGRTVIKYQSSQWAMFNFLPQAKNSLIAVLPDASVATFSSSEFADLDLNRLKREKKHTFRLKKSGQKVTRPEDLKEIINSIS